MSLITVNSQTCSSIIGHDRYQKVLDEVLMLNASREMIGEHDFFAFQKSGSNRTNSITKNRRFDFC